ncbi:MAG: hypothetical protein EOL95_11695, partial [Bacteroidia bacterium]|nr:hypothetical protein [Bacteroidia bacterium]
VSPYYVENGSGTKSGAFSKHYYAGSDRIASKTADDAYFYFTDHLGSTTHITDRSGDVAQYAAYTPYGSLFREYRSVQPYKFNGKELDQETGYYYYGARYYDPSSTLFLGVDPLADKYPGIGGYIYCAGNPIRYVDPDGRDVWEINEAGEITSHIKDKTQDAFYMVAKDADGNYQRTYTTDANGNKNYNSVSFEYGTVENFQSQYSDDAKTTFLWYNVRGDNNGQQLFELFADNTNVEFSQLQLGQKGDNGLNIISTSCDKSTERSANFLLNNQYKFGYTIRGHNHNHPDNTPYPSGLSSRGSDIGFSNSLTNISLRNGSDIPAFKIYLSKTGKYVKYDRNSTIFDFPETTPIIDLSTVTVSP